MSETKSLGDVVTSNIRVSRKARYALKEAQISGESLSDAILRLATASIERKNTK